MPVICQCWRRNSSRITNCLCAFNSTLATPYFQLTFNATLLSHSFPFTHCAMSIRIIINIISVTAFGGQSRRLTARLRAWLTDLHLPAAHRLSAIIIIPSHTKKKINTATTNYNNNKSNHGEKKFFKRRRVPICHKSSQ